METIRPNITRVECVGGYYAGCVGTVVEITEGYYHVLVSLGADGNASGFCNLVLFDRLSSADYFKIIE